ncbi:MAG: EAL domain-containing protein [Synergistales bacterium]|nr:EAL domain-containing protein [Synergistales bacterium]
MKIRDRNFLLISGLVLCTFVLVGAILFYNFSNILEKNRSISFAVMRSSLLQKFEDRSREISNSLASDVSVVLEENNMNGVRNLISSVRSDSDTLYGCLYDPQGNIISDGSTLVSGKKNIRELFNLTNLFSSNVQWDDGRTILYAISPVYVSGAPYGGICIIRSSSFVDNALASLKDVLTTTDRENIRSGAIFLIMAAGILLVLVALSSFAIAHRVTRPLHIISGIVQRISKADYDIAIPFEYHDEMGDLARSLASMAKVLKETTVSRDDLKNILESMHDGVIVVDSSGVIKDLNPALTELLNCPASKLLNMHVDSILSMLDEGGNSSWRDFLNSDVIRDREISFTSSNGKILHFSLNVSPINDDGTKGNGAVFVFHDITEHRYLEKQLRYNALHDSLTGLPNRTMMLSKLEKALKRYLHDEKASFDVLFIDLDRFKNINDNLGHGMGDEVLKVVAQRLVNLTRPFDLVSRFGGDEFIIILDNKGKPSAAEIVAKRIIEGVSRPINLQGRQVYISGSIGIVNSSCGGKTASEFLANADRAMYAAKARGRGQSALYNASLIQGKNNLLLMEAELRKAIEENRIEVYYQPVVSVKENRIVGFEALVRWQREPGNLTLPGEFISLAEETGLILPLGRIVLEKSLAQLSDWNKAFPSDQFFMSVNISAPLFTDHDLYSDIVNSIDNSGISPSRLVLEVTESLIITNPSVAVDILTKLKDKGIRLAIDDFGTGYSSLSFLHYFPFDILKIDRSFIANMSHNTNSMKIVRGIAELAHNLEMVIVAEGVETSEDLDHITAMGCHYYQGYYSAPPLSAEEMAKLLRNRARLTYLKRNMEDPERE